MADSSNTRLDAAARAIFDAWNSDEALAFLRNVVPAEEGECRAFAEAAVNAIDEISEPGVERLVAALRGILDSIVIDESDGNHDVRIPNRGSLAIAVNDAKIALAEFGQQPTGDES